MNNRFQTLMGRKAILLADGAMASNLFALGLKPGEPAELWNSTAPEIIATLHQQFVDAGADILLTNSFGANACRLEQHGKTADVRPLNIAAARIAKSVAEKAEREIIVAGSMGPLGHEIKLSGDFSSGKAVAAFKEQADALAEGGVDILWVETISGRAELTSALAAARSTGLPVISTLSFHRGAAGKDILHPSDLPLFCRKIADPPVAWGTNCGDGPGEAITHLLDFGKLGEAGDVLVAKANCGLPELKDAVLSYPASPEMMGDYARLAADAGARIIGGCCGATPAHIKAMAAALDGYLPKHKPTRQGIEAIFNPLTHG